MRKLSLIVLGMVIVGNAAAGNYERVSYRDGQWQKRDYAIVRNVTPQYEQIIQPRQQCSTELITEQLPRSNNYAGAIIGGVAGGALGHQVGKGRGKTVATVAGTLLGAYVGTQVGNTPPETVQREVQHCRQVNDYVQQLRGYQVDYEYRSQIYSATMERDPGPVGRRIPVRVMVELADQ
ncbi:glycine zipper 2TM domain-containing protein [Chitinibacter sp. S2-10]|uniref:glycine zipper 2TM domain-containing protein n=1 Tax=Chitinibacter sp. S2-10 TaxID=3373597 RepID=UPI003977868A